MTDVLASVEPARARESPHTLDFGLAVDSQGGEGMPLRVPLSVLTGQVLLTGDDEEVPRAIARLLGQLTAAGIPWLRVGKLPVRTADPSGVTVIDLKDRRGIPLTIDPFLPEPGYPEIAHAEALSALLAAVFALDGPYPDVVGLALRALYAARPPHAPAPATSQVECAVLGAARELGYGRDIRTALRGFVRLRLAALCGPGTGMLLGGGHPADMAELVRHNVDLVTGDTGGAGGRELLAGAVALRVAEHACRLPPAVSGTPRHVLVLEEAGFPLGGSPAARRVARLLAEAGTRGTGIVITGHALPRPPRRSDGIALTIAYQPEVAVASGPVLHAPVTVRVPAPLPADQDPAAAAPVPALTAPVPAFTAPRFWPAAQTRAAPRQPSVTRLITHRMAGCSRSCRSGKPCARDEIVAAATLARAPTQEAAWLRLWARVLLIAFLTGRPLPAVPPPLRAAGGAGRPRVIECALAAIAEREVAERVSALRDCFPSASLVRALTGVAAVMLAGRRAPVMAGQVWIIPQLRWAHEATRVGWVPAPTDSPSRGTVPCGTVPCGTVPCGTVPCGTVPCGAVPRGAVRPSDLAPPLDFAIAGLPDWTGIMARERLNLLLCHPLSLDAAPNRRAAAAALFGEYGRDAFDAGVAADLAIVAPALAPPPEAPANALSSLSSLSDTARLMECDGDWLVTVMRWTSSG